MADALTPPQGLIAVTDRRNIYGFPMGIPTGGAGTAVQLHPPPTYRDGGGMKIELIGDYEPAVYPPTVEFVSHTKTAGGGVAVSFVSPHGVCQGSGNMVFVVPESQIPKIRCSSGSGLGSITVIP